MNYTITFIGAMSGQPTYTEQDIIQLLETQQVTLIHGHAFTGRPTTKIHIDASNVLKIHGEIVLDLFSAKRWAAQVLEKEKNLQICHPHKTWFIAESGQYPNALIGNICPRLRPLHELFAESELKIIKRLDYLNQLFDHYFRVAKTASIRLDEGLSNFGISREDQLYYLDDDVYAWDRFTSCAHALGVYFRSLPWMTSTIADQLGRNVRTLILRYFNDAQYPIVLAEQLKDVFMPSANQKQIVEGFLGGLYPKQQQVTVNLVKSRYFALLSDVHANLPALETVLEFLKTRRIQQGIILGDIVGYGPHPVQCIERLQDTGFPVIKGNHDHGLATGRFQKGFSATAAWVLDWSMNEVTLAHREWLANLPPVLQEECWLAVHGAPIDPTFFNAYVYEMTYHNNLDVLQRKNISYCFHGHTHQPGVYARKGGVIDGHYHSEIVSLTQFSHALICPGSVGQPRNGQKGAQFAIYDREERKIHYYNLQYDIEPIVQEMQTKGFPENLIKMLQG